jgi:hypothetical protein
MSAPKGLKNSLRNSGEDICQNSQKVKEQKNPQLLSRQSLECLSVKSLALSYTEVFLFRRNRGTSLNNKITLDQVFLRVC